MQQINLDTPTSQQRLRSRGICVIIPTYNNAGTIADVVARAKEQCDDVIVVNDGCTDDTSRILSSITGITVVTLSTNSGKGHALREGFRKALDMGFAYAITLDADGQHFPEDIPALLKANIENPGALLIGERKDLDSKERSGGSKFANAFSNFWFAVQTAQRLRDTQTGYRLYPLHKLHGLSLLTSRYEAELEIIVFAAWHGVKLVQVPVNVFYPSKEERVSHFRPYADFTRISILNTVLCFLAVIYALPLAVIRKTLTVLRTVYALLFFLIFTLCIMTPLAKLFIRFNKMEEGNRLKLHKMLQFMGQFVMSYHGIPGVKSSIGNKYNEDFSRPAVILCNHQSHLDLMPMLQLTHKLVVLTKDWVWNNPFYGYVIRNAEFYPVSRGMEELLPQLQSLVERGYSIVVYPEGTRSEDCSINRFHKGAFALAKELGVDILPTILYGAGKVLPKKAKHLHKGVMHIEIDRRFSPQEQEEIGDLRIRSQWFRKYYKKRYRELCDEFEHYA
ncbi:MAG: glycosyltransferase [Prevotella sp.]|nr:glycosyltransferase [Candidatus Prevotella equi]